MSCSSSRSDLSVGDSHTDTIKVRGAAHEPHEQLTPEDQEYIDTLKKEYESEKRLTHCAETLLEAYREDAVSTDCFYERAAKKTRDWNKKHSQVRSELNRARRKASLAHSILLEQKRRLKKLTKLAQDREARLRHLTKCMLCPDTIRTPMMLMDCGHLFDRKCIFDHFTVQRASNAVISCPLCETRVGRRPVPCYSLRTSFDAQRKAIDQKSSIHDEDCDLTIRRQVAARFDETWSTRELASLRSFVPGDLEIPRTWDDNEDSEEGDNQEEEGDQPEEEVEEEEEGEDDEGGEGQPSSLDLDEDIDEEELEDEIEEEEEAMLEEEEKVEEERDDNEDDEEQVNLGGMTLKEMLIALEEEQTW
ncbi:hypothetical protein K435DRAFT_849223 [Dendrothele bispora CBS 962.96]|uniref:RING-type domain-containing protein n=1 Tax=Dendrothele bispora (strain CBS 962.96) TaxID=1314807 RepID=A0A4S8MSU6_DENBC|nr:hypothetical protein K435DRAFT_849223 [Dendrothele bispora CBS 962.96]